MPLPGGASQKVGDRYENWAVVYYMIDVLTQKASAISPQALGTNVDDFVLTSKDGKNKNFQVKRQLSSGYWTLVELERENILSTFVSQLNEDPDCECHFVSGVSATELAELTERARQSANFSDFQSKFVSTTT